MTPAASSSTARASPSPVVVPYDGGADIEVCGVVKALDPETKRVTVELTATAAGEKVLGRAIAVAVLD